MAKRKTRESLLHSSKLPVIASPYPFLFRLLLLLLLLLLPLLLMLFLPSSSPLPSSLSASTMGSHSTELRLHFPVKFLVPANVRRIGITQLSQDYLGARPVTRLLPTHLRRNARQSHNDLFDVHFIVHDISLHAMLYIRPIIVQIRHEFAKALHFRFSALPFTSLPSVLQSWHCCCNRQATSFTSNCTSCRRASAVSREREEGGQ